MRGGFSLPHLDAAHGACCQCPCSCVGAVPWCVVHRCGGQAVAWCRCGRCPGAFVWCVVQVQDMERFFKRTRSSSSGSSNEPNAIEQVENQSHVELNLDDIVSDPGLQKSIEEFDIAIQDQARREYVLRGPCQPNGHVYPKITFENVDNAFIKDGYNNWKRALEIFNRHMGTVNSCHNEARIQFEAFQDQRHSVGNILRVHSRDMEIDYHTRLTVMLDVTRFLLKQGLPFLGHDESTSSSNREITLAIINDIGDKFFSLMVDEARDSSVKEHMRVVLRLRGQGYDGASNMRDEFNGLKSLVLQENPFAMYVHCFSHRLQLVLVAVAHDNFTKLVETENHLVFPLVYHMIELALLLPVATASVKRVFSAMKTVKTDLRNRMEDQWMNDSLVSRRIQLSPSVLTHRPSQTSVPTRKKEIFAIKVFFVHR
ncbi:uncharacterized protein LOC122021560 [Zingiber officinale]|uniref:uncharacterized protein LOC122021560 n=1 Tax=Zingiber officinale TaxID=94328 RepID=UPI001C4BE2B0|nr:uncharacterized protein LOC122021560 [Zingiber officinale]